MYWPNVLPNLARVNQTIAFGPINFPPSQRHPNSKSRVKALRISDNFWKSIRRVAALERRLTAAAANHTTNQWFLQLVQHSLNNRLPFHCPADHSPQERPSPGHTTTRRRWASPSATVHRTRQIPLAPPHPTPRFDSIRVPKARRPPQPRRAQCAPCQVPPAVST